MRLQEGVWMERQNSSVDYRKALQDFIKYQIHTLIHCLASTGEESFLVTASLAENIASSCGSNKGQAFLGNKTLSLFKEQFLDFCKETPSMPSPMTPNIPTSSVDLGTEEEEESSISSNPQNYLMQEVPAVEPEPRVSHSPVVQSRPQLTARQQERRRNREIMESQGEGASGKPERKRQRNSDVEPQTEGSSEVDRRTTSEFKVGQRSTRMMYDQPQHPTFVQSHDFMLETTVGSEESFTTESHCRNIKIEADMEDSPVGRKETVVAAVHSVKVADEQGIIVKIEAEEDENDVIQISVDSPSVYPKTLNSGGTGDSEIDLNAPSNLSYFSVNDFVTRETELFVRPSETPLEPDEASKTADQLESAISESFISAPTVENVSGKTVYKCPICQKQLSSSSHYFEHVRRHTKECRHTCFKCGKGYPAKSDMLRHMYRNHGIAPYSCVMCKTGYRTKRDSEFCLKSHAKDALKTENI